MGVVGARELFDISKVTAFFIPHPPPLEIEDCVQHVDAAVQQYPPSAQPLGVEHPRQVVGIRPPSPADPGVVSHVLHYQCHGHANPQPRCC